MCQGASQSCQQTLWVLILSMACSISSTKIVIGLFTISYFMSYRRAEGFLHLYPVGVSLPFLVECG